MGRAVDDRAKLSDQVNATIDGLLEPGETIALTMEGSLRASLAASDRCVYLHKKGQVSTIPLSEIDHVEWGTGMLLKWVALRGPSLDPSTPGVTTVADHPHAMQVKKIRDDERARLEELVKTSPSPGGAMRLAEYTVIYLGGLPEHPDKHSSGIKFLVWPDGFELVPDPASRSWFDGLEIPLESVNAFEIVQRQVSTIEGLLGGIDSHQLNQANNIHITFSRDGKELILRLEMLSGVTVMGQAGRCRELIDRLRTNGILQRIESGAAAAATPSPAPTASPTQADDIPTRLRELVALRDEGILTPDEYETKKADLLSRM